MDANYWVLGIGSDCDGYNRGHITAFSDRDEANNYADSQNEWSDGIRYIVTKSIDVLKEYCDDYMKDWKNYLEV